MRNRGPRTTAALAVVAAALIAAGCSNSAAQPTPSPTPSTTVAATTTAPTPSDTAIDQAKQAITAWNMVYNQVSQNPGGDLSRINTVAAGQAAANMTSEIQAGKAKGVHAAGDIVIISLKPTGANITKSDADVIADVCYDVGKTQVVDAQGKAQPHGATMQAGAPDGSDNIITVPWRDQRLAHVTVHNSSWPDPSAWRVTKAEQRNDPCQ